MAINLVSTSVDFKYQEEIGIIEELWIKKIKMIGDTRIQFLSSINPYDHTFFNKKQLIQLKKEISILKSITSFSNKELAIIEFAIEVTNSNNNYDYLHFIGD